MPSFCGRCDVDRNRHFRGGLDVLVEYGLEDRALCNTNGLRKLAKEVALPEFRHWPDQPRYVGRASIGPTTKLPTLGHIPYFDAMNGVVPGGRRRELIAGDCGSAAGGNLPGVLADSRRLLQGNRGRLSSNRPTRPLNGVGSPWKHRAPCLVGFRYQPAVCGGFFELSRLTSRSTGPPPEQMEEHVRY